MAIIYIVGPAGAGKTSTGKLLAKQLSYAHHDPDFIFYKKYSLISNFIVKRGWKNFCDVIFRILKEVSVGNSVISTGGSVFMNDTNTGVDIKKVKFCKNKGIIVALIPSSSIMGGARICFERSKIRDKTILGDALPSESFEDYLKRYNIKFHSYKRYSDMIIYDNVSPESALNKIIKKLKIS